MFFVEQDGKVRVASMRNELNGNVKNMISGFLKSNRMEPSTGRRNDIGGVPARRTLIPLQDTEAVLTMHEVAVGCINNP